MRRLFLVLAAGLVAALALPGCVEPYHGSRIEMTIVGLPPLQREPTAGAADPLARHYELWATIGHTAPVTEATAGDTVVRVLDDGFTVESVLGRMRLAAPPAGEDPLEYLFVDPCMMDRNTGEKIYYRPSELQAELQRRGLTEESDWYIERRRIQTRTLALAANSILAAVSYSFRTAPPSIAPTTDAERLEQCEAFFRGDDCAGAERDVCVRDRARYYVGSPDEITYPINGTFFGALGDQMEVQDPYAHLMLGGMELKPRVKLTGLVGLFVTVVDDRFDDTGDLTVDANARGAVLTSGLAVPWAPSVMRVEFSNAGSTIHGVATVYVRMDNDPVQF